MNRKGFAPIIILWMVACIIAIGGIWYFVTHKSVPTTELQSSSHTTSSAEEVSTTTDISASAMTSSPTSSTQAMITSSSSAQVGPFAVVAYCTDISPVDIASVDHITIFNGSSTLQTIPIARGIAPGSHSCPPITAQDINFDGYPDFMIADDYGSGGLSVVYWLYNTSTGQFYCPGGNYNNCSLTNPSFDPSSKTVTSQAPLGASDSFSQLYEITGGVLTLYQETDIDYSITTKLTTKTVKQLENGQMAVISTSTVPESTPATNSTNASQSAFTLPIESSTIMASFSQVDSSFSQYANASSDILIVPVYQLFPATSTQSDIYSGIPQNDPGYYSSVQYNIGNLEFVLNKGISILYNGTIVATSSAGSSGGDNFDPDNAVTTFEYQGKEYFLLVNTDCEVAGCFSDISLYSLDDHGVFSGGRIYETNYGPDAISGPNEVLGAVQENGKLYIIVGPGPAYAIFVLDGAGDLETIAAKTTPGVISFPATVVPVSTSTVPLNVQNIASSTVGDGG